jgi:hypothetical protein
MNIRDQEITNCKLRIRLRLVSIIFTTLKFQLNNNPLQNTASSELSNSLYKKVEVKNR